MGFLCNAALVSNTLQQTLSIISSSKRNNVYHKESLFLKATYSFFKHTKKESYIQSVDKVQLIEDAKVL